MCYLSEIDQITAFVAIFGQKTGNKLQYIVNNGGQNNVIIAKKSNFIHRYEIAHKTAFFSTRIMAPVPIILKLPCSEPYTPSRGVAGKEKVGGPPLLMVTS